MRIDFSAPVVVTDENDDQVTDRSVLSRLRGVCFSEIIFTDYFDGTPEEMRVAVHLDRGGAIELVAGDCDDSLHALTSYRAARKLSDDELAILESLIEGQTCMGVRVTAAPLWRPAPRRAISRMRMPPKWPPCCWRGAGLNVPSGRERCRSRRIAVNPN